MRFTFDKNTLYCQPTSPWNYIWVFVKLRVLSQLLVNSFKVFNSQRGGEDPKS